MFVVSFECQIALISHIYRTISDYVEKKQLFVLFFQFFVDNELKHDYYGFIVILFVKLTKGVKGNT